MITAASQTHIQASQPISATAHYLHIRRINKFPTKNTVLQCNYFNARSLTAKSKLIELHAYLNQLKPTLLFVSETWLSSKYPDSLLTADLPYYLCRADRKKRGGGTAIFISNLLTFSKVPTLADCDFSIACADIFYHNIEQLRICAVYRPPSLSADHTRILLDSLQELCTVPYPVLICGDFNLRNVDWEIN